MADPDQMLRDEIFGEVNDERLRQLVKWGVQHRENFRLGWTQRKAESFRDLARINCDWAEGTTRKAAWQEILEEETLEAYAEQSDKAKLRKELIQCLAVLTAWVEDLDTH